MKYHIMFPHRVHVLHLWISKWNYIDIYIPPICISAWTSLTGHQGICGVQTSGSRPSKEASVWFLFDINFSGKDIWKDVRHQFEEIRLHQFCDQLTFCQHHRSAAIVAVSSGDHIETNIDREMAASATVNIKERKGTQIPDNIMLPQQSHHWPIILDQVAIKDLQDQGYLFVHLLREEYHHLER